MNRQLVVGLLLTLGVVAGASPAAALPNTQTPSGSEQAQTYFKEGYQHQKAGRYDEAIRAYEQSLKHDPRQAEALSNMGFCYKSLKRYQKAIGYYKDAIHYNPKLAEAHEYLGEAYLAIGKIELARREYKVLVELGSDEADELKEHIDRQLNVSKSQDGTPQH